MKARRIVLARSLNAAPVAADFRLETFETGAPASGEILVRTVYLSLDPYVGSILRGRHLGESPPQVGEIIVGRGVAEVIESRAAQFAPGDFIRGEIGWRDHAVLSERMVAKISPLDAPLSAQLGVAGMPGLTAWAGLTQLAKISGGEHVLVSSAAGGVGGAVGQIARILGAARVVGIAGSDEKCEAATRIYGFDACINYKRADWRDMLKEALPRGADIYFDNVGGDVLAAAIVNLANYGRIVLCGLASQYQSDERPAGPNPGVFIAKRAQVFGLVVYDFENRQQEYTQLAGRWISEGRLKVKEDRAEGLGAAPAHFERLMRGENLGKAIVVVGPERNAA